MSLTPEQIVRAWKDEEYRNSLSPEELAQLPATPAEADSLSDSDLEEIAGGGSCTVLSCYSAVSEV